MPYFPCSLLPGVTDLKLEVSMPRTCHRSPLASPQSLLGFLPIDVRDVEKSSSTPLIPGYFQGTPAAIPK
ncbi:hypothetical protein FA13DRAFT_1733335 [Coprinellus micaceus]|uniref:Uncharacterized protein n=1 Tax=Coprinellus micaceus TaxID=71717 RepID=A0A4Y7T9X6_COPMI|nr:hypothetical protein FA13DRAFT_1733335 [Coprinellus micaceus]